MTKLSSSAERLDHLLADQALSLSKMTLSDRIKPDFIATKVTIHPVLIKSERLWQWSWQEGRQQRHENLNWSTTARQVTRLLGTTFRQAVIVSSRSETHITASKPDGWKFKERLLESSGSQIPSTIPVSHNRTKAYLIPEGQPCPFLEAIGVMTPEGKVRASQYHKFRQINRFLEMIDDVSEHLTPGKDGSLKVVDYGSGKSYLTFAMQHYFQVKGIPARLTAIDVRSDVVETCRRIAEGLAIDNIDFRVGAIAEFQEGEPIDLAVALHACDTATDDALKLAVSRQASVILAVPCCQHEVRPMLSGDLLAPMWKHGILKEQFASLLTDTLRSMALERDGYNVQIMEFIDLEHTHKNLLIRAVKRGSVDPRQQERLTEQMNSLTEFFGLRMANCRLNNGAI